MTNLEKKAEEYAQRAKHSRALWQTRRHAFIAGYQAALSDEKIIDKVECLVGYLEIWEESNLARPPELPKLIEETKDYIQSLNSKP